MTRFHAKKTESAPPTGCAGTLTNYLVANAARDSKAAYARRQAVLAGHTSERKVRDRKLDGFRPSTDRIVDGVAPSSLRGTLTNRWALAQTGVTLAQCATIYLPSAISRAMMVGCSTPHAQAVLLGLHIGLSFGLPLATRLGTELVENRWRASLFEGRRTRLQEALEARKELTENKDFLFLAEQELGSTGLAMDDKAITTAMMVFAAAKPLLLCALQLSLGMTPTGLAAIGAVTVGALLVTHLGDWLSQMGEQVHMEKHKENLTKTSEQLSEQVKKEELPAWSRDFTAHSRSYFHARARHETLDTFAVQLHLLPSLVVESAQTIAHHFELAARDAPQFQLSHALADLSTGMALFEGTRQFETLRLKVAGLGKQLEEHRAKMAESLQSSTLHEKDA